MKLFRMALFMAGGTCWIASALVFGSFLFYYVAQGAGLQFFLLPLSSGSVLMGLVHVVGFMTAIALCLVVGMGLFAHGLVSPVSNESGTRLVTDPSNDFTLRFAEIGRTLEYNDPEGTIHFPFMVGSEEKSIVLQRIAPRASFERRYQTAFDRTKHHCQSLGFRVEVPGASNSIPVKQHRA